MSSNQDVTTPTPSQEPLQKFFLAIFYWAIATIILLGLVYWVYQLTAPATEPQPTPNLTATLEQALLIALGPPTETPTPQTPTTPTQTPTRTRTPLATFTPTITPTPSPTATRTPLPLLPTLTPVLPGSGPEGFSLSHLSAEEYDYTITLLQGFPELLPEGRLDRRYFDSFYHASVLQSEAILAYPQQPLATQWRWGLAYNLAQMGDERSTVQYAYLLNNALNEGQVPLADLPGWIRAQDQRLDLQVLQVPPIQEHLSNYILQLETLGGALFFWVVETPDHFQVFALRDESNFTQPTRSELSWGDFTGDGLQELVLTTTGPDPRNVNFPSIFDLSTSPPKPLPFKPNQEFEIGLENQHRWLTTKADEPQLQFEATVYPPCPLTIRHTYQWSGQWFERIQASYQVTPVSSLLEFCELLVDQAATVWGPSAAIQIMEALLPEWPPQTTSGKTYPPDEGDQWRYRLGVYHALMGDLTSADSYFQEVIRSPAIPWSPWVEAARRFARDYTTPGGLYRACVEATFCNPRLALKNWVASLPPEQVPDALYYLAEGGVAIRSTAPFDFDGDGVLERWFTLRHTLASRLEFWILVESETGARAFFIDTVDTSQPVLTRYTDPNGRAYVWLGRQHSFRLTRVANSPEVSITSLPATYYFTDFTNRVAKDALQALLSGFSPATIRNQLVEFYDSDTFLCTTKEDCARFFYALGLAAELSGQEELAIEFYLKIWQEAFESPFATVARMKLAYKPGFGPPSTPTPTPSNTPTATPTFTLTPTTAPTSTATPTPDPNQTATPTPSITLTPPPTNTSEPYP